MKLGPGFLVRFILLEWDQHRLDRLLVAMKQSLREGAEGEYTASMKHPLQTLLFTLILLSLSVVQPISHDCSCTTTTGLGAFK